MVKRLNWFIVCLLFSIQVLQLAAGKQYNSYKGLVMTGWRSGWFNAPDDGHRGVLIALYRDTMNGFLYSCTEPTFGRKCRIYQKTCIRRSSSLQTECPLILSLRTMRSTVDTHFRWMKEYGLDGVFMQRLSVKSVVKWFETFQYCFELCHESRPINTSVPFVSCMI